MKLSQCEAWNFGSYSHLDFDFSSPGLGLVYGKTGSGKSMLADLPAWILFGITAKNGAADDVRSWQSPDQPTKGVLDVQLPKGSIQVTRIRGKAGQNDLYWTEGSSDEKRRGKDLAETQRLLSDLLGVDAILYLSSSYFCDFSPSGQFFVAKAKDRRELFEKLASLSLPVKLAERSSADRKAAKKELEKSEMDLAKASGRLEQIKESHKELTKASESWAEKHQAEVKALTEKVKPAEVAFIKDELKEIAALVPQLVAAQKEHQKCLSHQVSRADEYNRLNNVNDTTCPTCLSPQVHNTARHSRLAELAQVIKKAKINTDDAKAKWERIQAAMEKEDVLEADLRKLERAQADLDNLEKENPFAPQLEKLVKQYAEADARVDSLEGQVFHGKVKVARLTRLYDLSFELRGELMRKTVREIEASTNIYLDKHFDSEIRVHFLMENSDDLEVLIQKSGFECSFRQLSKGQRQLLKLCFAVSVMAASANAAGIHFDNLLFDEALDGLDDDLKVKAFALFSELELSHESILMIDHAPAFQNLFTTKYHVTMDSDISSIEHEQS